MKNHLLSVTILLFLSLFIISCEREISIENGGVPGVNTGGGSAGGSAQYSFDGGTAACTGAALSGTFTAGTTVTAANSVALSVTVDSIGSWTVTTSTVNGVSFSGSGNFTVTGAQTIVLNASGTPTTAGTYNFTPGANNCAFSVTVAPGAIPVTGDFRAKIEGVQWVADKYAQCARMNNIINITGLGLDKKTITITIQDSGVHNYTLAWDNTSLGAGAYQDSALADITAFTSNAGTSPSQAGGNVNITSINEVTKTMSGTFSFKAVRQITGETRTITEGVFNNIPYITSLPPTASTDTFNVKIDGVAFSPVSVFGIKNTIGLSNIAISGSDASGTKTVGVYFPVDVTPGTYTIGIAFSDYFGQYNINSTTYLSSTTGTLEILFHDPATKRVRGRFNFSAELFPTGGSPAQLTEGYFAVTYL